MISLHRLGQRGETFHLNPDVIVTIEGNPDTVITLATGAKVVVAETPEQVASRIRDYRVDVLTRAMHPHPRSIDDDRPHLHAVEAFEPL